MTLALKDPDKLNPKMRYAVDDYIDNVYVRGAAAYTYQQAMMKAGYAKNYAAAYGKKVFESIAVQQILSAFKVKVESRRLKQAASTKEWCIEKHIEEIERCQRKGDEATATTNIIAVGKTDAIYSDNLNVTDTGKEREIDERTALLVDALGEMLITSRNLLPNPVKVVDATVVTQDTANSRQDAPGLMRPDESEVIYPSGESAQ